MSAQATYSYRARERNGEVSVGSMIASSANEVGAKLRAEGKFVLAIDDKPLRSTTQIDEKQLRRSEAAKRVRRDDVIAFCQQLSVMLETGVPLREALDAFSRQTGRKEFRIVLASLLDAVCAGEPLSVVMARWPRVFPNMMLSLMKASEASGTMSMMLGRIGNYLHKERQTARQIRGALGYPLFMMGTAIAMTVFLMTFVLPRFAKIYESRSATLPTATQVLLSLSKFLTTQYMYYVPALILFAIAFFFWARTIAGRRVLDWLRLSVPVVGGMFEQLYITRSARTMSTLLASGVNVLDIIDICRGVTNNRVYDDLWNDMEQGVRNGDQISDSILRFKHIPPNVSSMIASGERSGRLASVMDRIAEFSDAELDVRVKQVTSYIEPIMIIFMGLVIGGVAMALLLPIFSMGKVISGG